MTTRSERRPTPWRTVRWGKYPSVAASISGSEDLTVNINSTYPVGSLWSSYENNAMNSTLRPRLT